MRFKNDAKLMTTLKQVTFLKIYIFVHLFSYISVITKNIAAFLLMSRKLLNIAFDDFNTAN